MKISDDSGQTLATVDIEVTPDDVRRLADAFSRLAERDNLTPGFRVSLAAHPADDEAAR
jgi:hypothetical protein